MEEIVPSWDTGISKAKILTHQPVGFGTCYSTIVIKCELDLKITSYLK
jgi:hypothetical protein